MSDEEKITMEEFLRESSACSEVIIDLDEFLFDNLDLVDYVEFRIRLSQRRSKNIWIPKWKMKSITSIHAAYFDGEKMNFPRYNRITIRSCASA